MFLYSYQLINCQLILCMIHVLAIVGSDTFLCLALLCMYYPFWLYQKLYNVIYTVFCTFVKYFVFSFCVSTFVFN